MKNQHEFVVALKCLIQSRVRYFSTWEGQVLELDEDGIDDVAGAAAEDAFHFIDNLLWQKYMNDEWRDENCLMEKRR